MKTLVAVPDWIKKSPNSDLNKMDQNILILHSESHRAFASAFSHFVNQCMLLEVGNENSLEKAFQVFHRGRFDAVYFLSCQIDNYIQTPHEEALIFLKLLKKFHRIESIKIKVIVQNAIKTFENQKIICPLDASLIGLCQCASKEFYNWSMSFINIDELNARNITLIRQENGFENSNKDPIALIQGERFIRRLFETEMPKKKNSKFRVGGRYLIVGGAKGIGFELAKYLSKNYHAKLFLLGRSLKDEAKLQSLSDLGGEAEYFQIDICNRKELTTIFSRIKSFDGVIHSGIVLEDRSILEMDKETFLKVLQPKVEGSINLFQASIPCQPKFYLFFSSVQSFIANPGQANYSAASTFQDAWAQYLRDTYMIDARVINWSFWGSVGIVATEEYRKRMEKLEIGSIEPEEGLEMIENLLSSELEQIAVIKASEDALKKLYVVLKKPSNNDILPSSLSKLIPSFDLHNPRVKRNIELQKALEQYTRWALHRTELPKTHIEQYHRLVNAIKNIPLEEIENPSQFLEKFPELHGHIRLLNHCLSKYPEVLTGQLDHMQVLFPDGSFDMVQSIYQNNPMADYFNDQVAEIVRRYLSGHSDQKCKVLEIGAGTGSTTERSLPFLGQFNIEYHFTDISLGFTRIAKQKWGKQYPFMQFRILDIEKENDWNEQFDVIIATNVLHATRVIKNTVKNVTAFMKKGGIVIINEVTNRQDFATLTFGLTSGWWLYDDYRIPDSPLISGESWSQLLHEHGFKEVATHGSDLQQVIIGHFSMLGEEKVVGNGYISGEKDVFSKNISNFEQKTQLEEYLIDLISEIMKFEKGELGPEMPFAEVGIDSLIVLEILKPLQKKFGYLPTTLLFEYPNIAKLADYLLKFHSEELSKLHLVSEPLIENQQHSEEVQKKVLYFLKSIISDVMKIPTDELEENKSFSEFGIDSLIVLEILKPLQKKVGYLPTTLLFEYPNLFILAQYFVEHYSSAFTPSDESTHNHSGKKPLERPKNISIIEDKIGSKDIAVVGISGSFPQAQNIKIFWDSLLKGYDGTSEIPPERWDATQFTDESEIDPNLAYSKIGGFIKGIEYFDYKFFNITPLDAEKMDPQERLFLQAVYHAIEDAGYIPHKISRNTGVFVGIMNGGYGWLGVDSKEMNDADSLYWSVANRISYHFDFNGPSMAVDTACSASLTAIHLAVQSIQSGECESAIVGGVNLIIHPKQYIKLSRLHMLSKRGKCSPFGKDADGFIDGEGIVAIVLKPMNQAVKDNDRIYGVIKGSAINSGGKTSGYTVPNPKSQENLIKKALQKANIGPDSISYLEAHGTGTALGDPIEMRGVTAVFGTGRNFPLHIGSVKGNIGHLESAAGITSLVKVCLQLHHQYLVPSIHAKESNPHIEKNNSLVIQHHPQYWEVVDSSGLRRAAVSSFGAGGANAHVILEEAPRAHKRHEQEIYILPISGATPLTLEKKLVELYHRLSNEQDLDLYGLCYTLSCCREHFPFREAFAFENLNELKNKIENRISFRNFSNFDFDKTKENVELFLRPENSLEEKKRFGRDLVREYLSGREISWNRIYSNRSIVSECFYPFEEVFCWLKNPSVGMTQIDRYYSHHRIGDQTILPAAMAFSLLGEELNHDFSLQDLTWLEPIQSTTKVAVEIGGGDFLISDSEDQKKYVIGHVGKKDFPEEISIPSIDKRKNHLLLRVELYERFAKKGYDYHKFYQRLLWVRSNDLEAIGAIELDLSSPFRIDPAIIDSALQLAITLEPFQSSKSNGVFVPFTLQDFYYKSIPLTSLNYCSIQVKKVEPDRFVIYDVVVMNEKKQPFIYGHNLTSVYIKYVTSQKEKLQEDQGMKGAVQFL